MEDLEQQMPNLKLQDEEQVFMYMLTTVLGVLLLLTGCIKPFQRWTLKWQYVQLTVMRGYELCPLQGGIVLLGLLMCWMCNYSYIFDLLLMCSLVPSHPSFFVAYSRKSKMPGNTSLVCDVKVEPRRVEPAYLCVRGTWPQTSTCSTIVHCTHVRSVTAHILMC